MRKKADHKWTSSKKTTAILLIGVLACWAVIQALIDVKEIYATDQGNSDQNQPTQSNQLNSDREASPVQYVISLDEPLITAIGSENVNEVSSLLNKGADPNARMANGMPILIGAAIQGNVQIVKRLVEKGADVNQSDPFTGWNALQSAQNEFRWEQVDRGKYLEVIRYLQTR